MRERVIIILKLWSDDIMVTPMQIEKARTTKQKDDIRNRLAAEKRLIKLEQWHRQGIGSSILLTKEINRLRREYGFPMY